MTGKSPGRVGDCPIIGAGTFADNASCAVSATGHGEFFIRYCAASEVAARMRRAGYSLDKAAGGVITGGRCRRLRRSRCDRPRRLSRRRSIARACIAVLPGRTASCMRSTATLPGTMTAPHNRRPDA